MGISRQTYGKALPDQVERIAGLFDSHLELISDVRELYRDRAALEREYAGKLQILAKRAADKKSKTEAFIVVGNDPTKNWDEHTLKTNTLNNAYTSLINSLINTAHHHGNLADAVSAQVVDVLKGAERKAGDLKKKEMQYFQKLLSDRDRAYSDRVKSKQKYNDECAELENHRQKQGKAHDDRHMERAAKQHQQQQNDMLNSKNVYIISTAIANTAKAKFYDEDLPALEDQFQDLQTFLVSRFVKILVHAQALQTSHLDACKGQIAAVETALEEVAAGADQDIFVDHNESMSVEPAPKVFLQNKLSRCRSKLQELAPMMEAKRKDFEKLSRLFDAHEQDHSLGEIDNIAENMLEAKQQLSFFATTECVLTAEINTIVAALGDDEGAQQPHSFKSSSFSIPTQCGYCKTSIWGLSKQGKTCKQCGLSVHSKCELKVPAECGRSRDKRQTGASLQSSSSVTRKDTRVSSRSSISSQGRGSSSFTTASPTRESFPVARVVYDFSPTSPFELAISDGELVQVIEEDDGSGWIKVADSEGGQGLVPASYIERNDDNHTSPASLSSQQGSGKYVRGLFEYRAQGSDELGVRKGELIELSAGPKGGGNYGDGWWEGINAEGRKGIFPSNYVEAT